MASGSRFGSRVSDLPSPTATCRVCGVSVVEGPLCEVCSVTVNGSRQRNDAADAMAFALLEGNGFILGAPRRGAGRAPKSAPVPQKPKVKVDQAPKRRRIRLDDE